MTHSEPKLARLAPSTASVRPVRLHVATARPVWCTAKVERPSAINENAPYGMTSGDSHQRPPAAAHTQRRFSSKPRGILAATIKKLAHPAGKSSTPTNSARPTKVRDVKRTDSALYRKSLTMWDRFVAVSPDGMSQPYATPEARIRPVVGIRPVGAGVPTT